MKVVIDACDCVWPVEDDQSQTDVVTSKERFEARQATRLVGKGMDLS